MKKPFFVLFCLLLFLSSPVLAAERFEGKNVQEWLSVADYALYRKDYRESLAAATNVLIIDPRQAEAYFIKGYSYAALGIRHQAIIEYSDAIMLDNKNEKYFFMRALSYIERHIYDEALNDLTSAIALSPDQSHLYQKRGQVNRKLEKYPEAIADFDKATALDDRDYLSYFEKAEICYVLGQKQDAAYCYQEFLNRAPSNTRRYLVDKANARLNELR